MQLFMLLGIPQQHWQTSAMKTNIHDISVVIIAGGKGSRLNNLDKGLVAYKNRPVIEHILHQLKGKTDNILINANRNHEIYQQYDYPVFSDELSDHQGPLAGISSAMQHAKTSHIITLPCDAPWFPGDYINRMLNNLNLLDTPLTVAHDGNRLQPLHALLPVKLKPELDNYLASNQRRTSGWYETLDFHITDFADQAAYFQNINTPEQLKALEQL